MIKNIFFDFDGVIADSVNVKTEAFYKMYLKYGKKIANEVVIHHKANGGMSRFEKFKLYHKEFLNVDLDKKEIDKLAKQFSDLVMQGVINSPQVKGSHDFLLQNKNKYQMFIITGTPTKEAVEICRARGIIDCFEEIYGSPQKKDYWCSHILKYYNLNQNETIFVGDALADYNAAKSSNLKFFLRQYPENESLFREINNITRFTDFIEFQKIIKDL